MTISFAVVAGAVSMGIAIGVGIRLLTAYRHTTLDKTDNVNIRHGGMSTQQHEQYAQIQQQMINDRMLQDIKRMAATSRNDLWCPNGWRHDPSSSSRGREVVCVYVTDTDPNRDSKMGGTQTSPSLNTCRAQKTATFDALDGAGRQTWVTQYCPGEQFASDKMLNKDLGFYYRTFVSGRYTGQ